MAKRGARCENVYMRAESCESCVERIAFNRGLGGAWWGCSKRQPLMAEDSNHDQVLDSCYSVPTKPLMKTLVPIPSKLGMILKLLGPVCCLQGPTLEHVLLGVPRFLLYHKNLILLIGEIFSFRHRDDIHAL